MNISQLLTELNDHDISISLDGGDLLLNYEGDTIAEPLVEKIRSNKGELVAYLKKYALQQDFTVIPPIPVQESYPVSYAQKRLWVLSQFTEISKAYTIPNQVELHQELDMEKLTRAVNAVIERHEVLRTVFREDEKGEVRQWVLPAEELNFRIEFVDYSEHEDAAGKADKYIEADGFKEFDLAMGPLFRASLIKLSEKRYRFYYIMHHIISDGWSLGVLIRDVLVYYSAFSKNTRPGIEPLEIQYKDYTQWHLAQLEEGSISEDKKYWLAQFKDDIPAFEIPGRPVRPAIKTNKGEILETYLSKETTAKLKQFTQTQKGSLFITLLSLWNALLYRYTDQQEMVTGTAVAGRDHAGLEEQIGFYVNTLALRNNISPDETFADYYAKVRTNALDAFSHQTFPFDLLVESLQLVRDNSRNPLFDVMLTLLSTNTGNSQAEPDPTLVNNIRYKGKRNAKFDIEVNAVEAGSYLQLIVNYNTDIYDAAFITQMLQHFRQLTDAVLNDPHKSVNEYDLLSAKERDQLLYAFNDTKQPYPQNKTITALFEEQVKSAPGNIAVVWDDGALTYEQLNEAANRLGFYLRYQYHIGPDDMVGIELPRTNALMIAIFGVLKAGGAYVPVDPANPVERKDYIKADAGCKCIIDQAFMEAFAAIANEFPGENPGRINNANSLVYVIYTSGSTGNPKGVMIENHSLVNRLIWMQQAYPLSTSDVILQKTTYSFDVSVWELLWWSLYGAKVRLLEPEGEKDPSTIVQTIHAADVTVMHFVPSMLSTFLNYLKQFPEEKNKLRSLRQVFTSGEALSKDHRDQLLQELPRVSLMNLYGPTEASIDVTWYDCNEERNDHIIPIGKPIANTQLYVLDQRLQLTPIGIKGRLYIAGVGLARGYVNNSALTGKKFIPHPFRPGERLYDTGDIALWLPDGNINFLGRADDQVKIRGFRIELGEIEYHLRSASGIADAVVLVKSTAAAQKDLIAFIVAKEEQQVTRLRNYLSAKVPHYMIPAFFVQVDHIPLSASGKANKKQLLSLNNLALADKVAYVAPASEQEKALITVCELVLNRKQISVKENFYNLGGDSIKSIQMVSRLKQLGYTLRVEDILRTPVLELLATLLVATTYKTDQSGVSGEIVLTPVQYYFFENTPVLNHFNQSVLLKSEAPMDLDILTRCLKQIVTHHDALRIIFKQQQDGTWEQFNNGPDAANYEFNTWDLTTSAQPLEEMKTIAGEMQASFDLSAGPLLKVAHFKLKDGERLALIIHHLATDGVSWRILLEDLLTLYRQGSENRALTLPAKTDSFQRWARLQQEYANSEKMVREADYWRAVCEEEVPALRTDHPYQGRIFPGDRGTFTLDERTTQLLQTKFHTVYNTEINDVLLTGLGLAIREVFGQDKVALKMEGHGREEIIDHVDISRTVGWFTTMYPFILNLEYTIDGVESLIRVKEDLRKIPNKGIGYGMLKYQNSAYCQLNYTPTVIFNFLGDFDSSFTDKDNNGITYATEGIGTNIAKQNTDEVLLNVSGSFVTGKLYIGINYSKSVHNEQTITQLLAAYKKHLVNLVEEVSREQFSFKTPSDLSFRGLTMKELSFINDGHNLEDVYELSPLQQGIYYHWLTGSSRSQYVEQISYRIQAKELKIAAIRTAYQKLLERYAVLRTGFVNHVRDFPLQVVRKEVQGRFFYSAIPASLDEKDVEDYIRQYKLTDRNEGFDLANDSLMRLKILNLGSDNYEFIWSHHHILMDGWCMSILIQDFNRILNAVNNNVPADLPAPRPYSDYIRWLTDLDTTVSLSYWRKYLEDYTVTAGIPFVKNNQEAVYREAVSSLKIEDPLLSKVRAVCSELGITQSTFLQTAWGFLLSKYNYTNDVVFGAVVSGRPAALNDIERMVGLFINTIPVRVRYEQDHTPFSLLKEVQEAGINSNAHHYLNLAKVQAQSELGAALLNHIIVFENFPVKEAIREDAAGVQRSMSIKQVEVFEQTNYDLNIIVMPSQNTLQVDIRFNAGKYESALMATLATHFYHVIEQFAISGNQPLQQIRYLSATDRNLIFNEFNATDVAYEADKTVLDLFREKVAELPDHVAVRYGDEQLSYRVLDTVTGQLAHHLHTQYGVGLNDLVGIRLERGVSMLVAVLGILKAGGAYVPVDTTYPEQRIQYIKTNSNYKVCIDSAFMQTFHSAAGSVMEDIKIPDTASAYAIYTSGSTGNPKGVLNEHAGLYNRLLWMRDDLGIAENDIILQKTPYTFDVSVWELLMPAITGSRLVFAKPEGHKDPMYLQELIAKEKITILHFVPSMLGIFLENLEAETCRSIKHIVCSGEALSAVLVEACKEKLPWIRLHNLYGPTEAAIDVTSIELTDVDTKVDGVSIGKPVANTRIYIVDKSLNPQPVGVPGELLIEGIQVARGYLNQPELTAAKFIDSPFNPGERIYRTGDLAKWLPNGEIAYMGRMDDQVKIRGNRIELGEIETRIKESGYIEQAAVIVKGDALRKYLVAYVIPREGYNREQLYSYLGAQLPEYMIPGMIMELEMFPLTSSGKLNRRALPEPMEVDNAETYVAPRNEVEAQLESIWKGVLGVEQIGIHDNFFRIGGDSIISIRLISRINNQFNVALTIGQLYESSTIARLSDVLQHYMDASANSEKIRNEVVTHIDELREKILKDIPDNGTIEDIYPMSDIQKGMVILSSLNPGAGVYHDQFIFHIPTVRPDLFKQAFSILIAKHAAFRTRFDLITYGEEIQIIDREIAVLIDHHDIKELEKPEQEEHIRDFMRSERRRPFDVQSGPMWRATIFNVSAGKDIFLFQFHHAILDGWSVASFNTELFKVYQLLNNDSAVRIENLRSTVRDAVIEELCEKKNPDTIQFWQQELADYKRLNLFGNKFCNLDVSKTYDFGFRYRLEQKCSHEGVPVKTVLYGAFVYVLGVLSGEDDFVTGMVTNSRPVVEDGDKILGCFLNTIPVRNRMVGNRQLSWSDYFQHVEKQLISLKSKERLTLYEISKITNEKATTGSPFFDIMFNYVDFHIYKEMGIPNESARKAQREKPLNILSYESTNTAFDFNVNLSGNDLVIDYKLRKELVPGITLEKIHQCLDKILATYLSSPDQIVSTTNFLTEAEHAQIFKQFNATDISYEGGKTVLDLFRERVAELPDQVAVCFAEEQLTYRELDTITGQLAHYLHTKYGVGLNDLVGIKLERGVPMLVAVLGILKAGGAYVPVDTSYPEQRIQYIKADSNYKVCIDEEFMQTFRSAAGPVIHDIEVLGSTAAYAIYTSGSTGNPKGVLNEHAGLYNRLLWMRDDLGISSNDIILQKTPYTFDVSVWELLMPAITGSRLVFAKPEGHKDPMYLQELIAKEKITILHFVPSMLGIFLENLEPEKCRSIKHIVCSGEALSAVLVEACKEKLPWVRLHNLYGPTEAAIDVTSIELTDVDTKVDGVSIGKPVANTRIYIVDKSLNPQPVGVPGELLIEGIQVARGYLNQPELSAAKFIDSPFNPGERIYRTGDLAKWLPNGEIAYMGRMDDQVKIRGNRIELGEIETRIKESGYIEQAAVIVKGDALRKYLVAYVIPREGYNREQLYSYLGAQLPEYMIPGMIMELEMFPLTSSGKLNRRALPEPMEADAIPESYVAPRNEMESTLAVLWSDVLGVERIGINDNFFRVGGDSIISIRLISRINKQLNAALTIAQLYQFNTIAGLSDQIKGNAASHEENKEIRQDIRMYFEKLKNEVFEN